MEESRIFVEVYDDAYNQVSHVREVKRSDVDEAYESFKNGECKHILRADSYGYMFDVRYCVLCGKGLGFI